MSARRAIDWRWIRTSRIREAVPTLVFRKFHEIGSVRQVALWFRDERIELPTVAYGPRGRIVEWHLPRYNSVHRLLTNPVYAGAYVFGRTVSQVRVESGRKVVRRGVRRSQDEWGVLTGESHMTFPLAIWLAAWRSGGFQLMGFSAGAVPWKSLLHALRKSLTHARTRVRHHLHEVLIIALCTMLCGGEDCSDMALFGEAKEPFLRQFLRLRHGIPSHDTFSRVFRRLDPAPFRACFVRFTERFAAALLGVVAIDGKTLRRSFDRAAGK